MEIENSTIHEDTEVPQADSKLKGHLFSRASHIICSIGLIFLLAGNPDTTSAQTTSGDCEGYVVKEGEKLADIMATRTGQIPTLAEYEALMEINQTYGIENDLADSSFNAGECIHWLPKDNQEREVISDTNGHNGFNDFMTNIFDVHFFLVGGGAFAIVLLYNVLFNPESMKKYNEEKAREEEEKRKWWDRFRKNPYGGPNE